MTKIVAVSDVHGKYAPEDWIKLPPGDILLIAGDFLANYSSIRSKDAILQKVEWEGLVPLLNSLPYERVFVIAGNHEFLFESYQYKYFQQGKVFYLEGQQISYKGLSFYGFPWQPRFYDWAFNIPRNSKEMQELLNKIPKDTDVLISHGPPFGYGDISSRNERCGCELMAEHLPNLKKLKLHVYGHIHPSYGRCEFPKGCISANVSVCNERYQPVNAPQVFSIEV